MAERRMFAKTIVDSDAFLDMSASAQALYFHLGMRADDDGFVNNPKKIQKITGAAEDDLRILLAKRFIIGFESGVIVIKHWKMHNYIQNDRYKPTVYEEEKSALIVKQNKAYSLNSSEPDVYKLEAGCIQGVSKTDIQVRLGKDRLGKASIGDTGTPSPDAELTSKSSKSKPTRHKYGEYDNVLLSDSDLEKLKAEFPDWQERIERLSSWMASKGATYKNHLATIRNWAKRDKERQPQALKTIEYIDTDGRWD